MLQKCNHLFLFSSKNSWKFTDNILCNSATWQTKKKQAKQTSLTDAIIPQSSNVTTTQMQIWYVICLKGRHQHCREQVSLLPGRAAILPWRRVFLPGKWKTMIRTVFTGHVKCRNQKWYKNSSLSTPLKIQITRCNLTYICTQFILSIKFCLFRE